MAYAITIGQAAKSSGMAAKTIRFYEEVGVLPAPTRTAAGYRQYTEEGIQQLLFVGRACGLGLSVRQLKELTATLDGGLRGPVRARVREVVRAHLSAVQGRITELRSLERQLEQVLRRIKTPARPRALGRCRCLDVEEAPGRSVRRGARHR